MDQTVHEILQARILEWVHFPFSRLTSQLTDQARAPTLQEGSLLAETQGKLSPISLPIPPLEVDTEPLFEFPETDSKFPLAIYFKYGHVSLQDTLSIHLTISSPLFMSISLLFMTVSPPMPWK